MNEANELKQPRHKRLSYIDRFWRKRNIFSVLLSVALLLGSVWAVYYIAHFLKIVGTAHISVAFAMLHMLRPFLLGLAILFFAGLDQCLLFWKLKSKASVIYVLLWVLLIKGDHFAGQAYFKYLCATKAGGHIYKTIDLPEMPKWDRKLSDVRFGLSETWNTYNVPSGISATHKALKHNEELISEDFRYEFFGGWFVHAMALGHPSVAERCGPLKTQTTNALTIQGKPYDAAMKYNSDKGSK